MTPPLSAFATLVLVFELGCVAAGVVLLWRNVLSPAARAEPLRLRAWDAPWPEFLAFLASLLLGTLLLAALAGLGARQAGLAGHAATIANGAGAQLGMLLGVFLHHRVLGPATGDTRAPARMLLGSGVAVFLAALPPLLLTAQLWEFALRAAGLPTARQNLIRILTEIESPVLFAAMVILAVLIAPVTEELVFRGGVFRYLRTRWPRWPAILLPAAFFAALHVNWSTLEGLSSALPLVVLAVFFSLAYERTGQLGTAVVAHACFNLNTLLVLFAGLGP
ncbi:MAG: CPBP family intramembrane metalloprotease [Verrucomicrobia bacterium]|nr:CPBP family intramembrane metalloprotease [Verrucomicrobiota bacterium]